MANALRRSQLNLFEEPKLLTVQKVFLRTRCKAGVRVCPGGILKASAEGVEGEGLPRFIGY
jgi:hypothetical protein